MLCMLSIFESLISVEDPLELTITTHIQIRGALVRGRIPPKKIVVSLLPLQSTQCRSYAVIAWVWCLWEITSLLKRPWIWWSESFSSLFASRPAGNNTRPWRRNHHRVIDTHELSPYLLVSCDVAVTYEFNNIVEKPPATNIMGLQQLLNHACTRVALVVSYGLITSVQSKSRPTLCDNGQLAIRRAYSTKKRWRNEYVRRNKSRVGGFLRSSDRYLRKRSKRLRS